MTARRTCRGVPACRRARPRSRAARDPRAASVPFKSRCCDEPLRSPLRPACRDRRRGARRRGDRRRQEHERGRIGAPPPTPHAGVAVDLRLRVAVAGKPYARKGYRPTVFVVNHAERCRSRRSTARPRRPEGSPCSLVFPSAGSWRYVVVDPVTGEWSTFPARSRQRREPRTARRDARRRARLPRAPGLGVDGARRGLLRRDDEPARPACAPRSPSACRSRRSRSSRESLARDGTLKVLFRDAPTAIRSRRC